MTDAGEAVRTALIAALGIEPELSGMAGLCRPATAQVLPQVSVEDPVSTDWGTKTARGRELRTAIGLRVAKGQVKRLPAMVAAAERAGEALTGDLGGWRVASTVLLRSRSFDAGDGTRAALIEHRVRVMEN